MENLKERYKKSFPRNTVSNDKAFGEDGWDVEEVDGCLKRVTTDFNPMGEIKDSYTDEKRAADIESAKEMVYADIEKDGFIWLRLSEYQALQCYVSGLFEVYWLRDDGTESLVDEISQISRVYEYSETCALEVGFIDPEIAMRM